MTSLSNHKRYHEFSLASCCAPSENENPPSLNIILFKDNRKLRNHAVKHFFNSSEFEAVWAKMTSFSHQTISKRIESVKNIGCLYYSMAAESPPCNACPFFSRCTDIMHDVDDAYLNCAKQVVEQCCQIPRFAYYIKKETTIHKIFALPDRPIVIIASQLDDNVFNLNTLYNVPNISFPKFREGQIIKIGYESERKAIVWYTENTWGMKTYRKEAKNSNKKIKKGKKKKLKPYSRHGKQSPKQYLNELNEWYDENYEY